MAVIPASGFDEGILLSLAAGVERSSEHPLAAAIVAAAAMSLSSVSVIGNALRLRIERLDPR